MHTISRYDQIKDLIEEEIDEVIQEDFEASGYETKESYRDELIANYMHFLKKDLQTDNA
jgi:hypothetical protein